MEGSGFMYLALYRKYRPQTFDDVISQGHITTTLKNQLKNGQTAHAYLFTGSRGTGKTTCAKILAKAINCQSPVNGNPCLTCESCRAIEEGATDVTEIDAASNNGVDSVRELKEEAVYAPISCRCRVYIIDEVHMLSVSAFNALLKLIEEPPPHVVFIFATTEIHKVPATILSRCQRFEFRRIDIDDSKERLLEIAEKEHMRLDEGAAALVSRISEGGMRDALSLLDQCFSVSPHVTEETVRECAGISGTEHLFRIADAARRHNAAEALTVLRELTERSKSPARLIEELIGHYRALMLLKAGADRSALHMGVEELSRYERQNEGYTPEMLLRALSILSDAFSGMSRTRNEALSCEMCLIRLCTPKLDTDEAALSGRIDALEKLVTDTVRQIKDGRVSAFPLGQGAPASAPTAPEKTVPAPEAPPALESEEPKKQSTPPTEEETRAFAPATKEKENPSDGEMGQAEPSAVEMPIDLPFDLDPPPPPEPADFDPFPPEQLPPEPPSLNEALGLAASVPPTAIPESEKAAEDRAELGVNPIAEGIVPEGYEPFAEWKTILESLPFSIRILIGDTTAMIGGNTVLVCGSELQKGYAAGEFAEELRTAVSRAIGRKVTIAAQPKQADAAEDREKKVRDFLDRARSQGVAIKEQ